jgi:uroporphyrinogen-III synthase
MVQPRALTGRTVVVTSPGSLSTRLRDLGVDVIDVATIEIVGDPIVDVDVGVYDWVAYTSANAVARVSPVGAQRVAAVGPATADAIRERGVAVDLVPREAIAEALVDAFPAGVGRVLVPQAERARPTLVDGLCAKGWTVDVVPAYATRPVAPTAAQLDAARAADAITFLSASATETWPPDDVPSTVVCIGPVTADAARQRGINVTAVADPHTIDGVIDALAKVLA